MNLKTGRVSELIKSIVGDNDDAFQDAWEAVLNDHVVGEEDVLRIATEIRHKYLSSSIQHSHREQSLSEPLGNTDDFTLEQVIPAEESGERDYPHRLKQPKRQKGVVLDEDVRTILKQRFPNLTYRNAIRQLVGVELIHQRKGLWQPWEDEVIKRVYPWGGGLAVSLEIGDRTPLAIRTRACLLGTGFDSLRPKAEWLTVADVAKVLGVGKYKVWHLARDKKLEHIQLPHNGKILYFTSDGISKFLRENPWEYYPENVARQYQGDIPPDRAEWISLSEAAEQAKCHITTVIKYRNEKLISYHRLGRRVVLVCLAEVLRAKEICQGRLRTALRKGQRKGVKKLKVKPYNTTLYRGLVHYVFQDAEGAWRLRCYANNTPPIVYSLEHQKKLNKDRQAVGMGVSKLDYPKFVGHKPTCKRCLWFYNAEKAKLKKGG